MIWFWFHHPRRQRGKLYLMLRYGHTSTHMQIHSLSPHLEESEYYPYNCSQINCMRWLPHTYIHTQSVRSDGLHPNCRAEYGRGRMWEGQVINHPVTSLFAIISFYLLCIFLYCYLYFLFLCLLPLHLPSLSLYMFSSAMQLLRFLSNHFVLFCLILCLFLILLFFALTLRLIGWSIIRKGGEKDGGGDERWCRGGGGGGGNDPDNAMKWIKMSLLSS